MKEYKAASILLVEDDLGDQKLIRNSFKNNRIATSLRTCSSGEEALEYLQKNATGGDDCWLPDLILLDLNMPGMGGKEFLRKIKEDESLSSIPVVVLTTSDSDKDVLESYQLQAAGYVKKPVDLPEFQKVVSELSDYWFVICKHVDYQGTCNERNLCVID